MIKTIINTNATLLLADSSGSAICILPRRDCAPSLKNTETRRKDSIYTIQNHVPCLCQYLYPPYRTSHRSCATIYDIVPVCRCCNKL